MARVPPSQRSSRKNWEQPNSHRASQTNQPKSAHDRRSQASNGRLSQHHKNVRPPTAHSNSRSPVESSSRSRRPSHHLEDKSGKCSQICTIRGILQIVEIMTGILVLICVIASYAVITGYTSAAGFGSFSIDSAYSPFEGNELKQVRDLDMQYSQLRVPGIYGGVPFILLLCGLTIFFLMVNSTDVCKTRERLYAGRGYTWMNCEVQGGDAAVALFGLIAACLYLPSAIMCALYIKTVREFQKNHLTHEYPRNSFKERDHNGSRNPEEELFHPSTFV
ncbi:uncharacterized protein LOC100137637 [Xenopus laevis]|uniref:LOC100137637 protein n=1 Tax=Xenopus laevis TaxID=8355 RepID=A9ULX2_XENLA|nr:uncharacterized protein LOC100137637 [Xenopus laevis]AAI57435.1 LOC100137637 protein [Xenopus laevis]